MRRIAIVHTGADLATSRALSHDVLATARQVAQALGRAMPFDVRILDDPRAEPTGCDALVIPGQGLADAAQVDAFLAGPDVSDWFAFLRACHASGATLVTSCSGVLLLAAAGLLDERACTTSWFLAPFLAHRHPRVRVHADALVVEDGPFITGGAALAQGEAVLALVARMAGFEVADLTARYLLLDNRRSQADFRLMRPLVAGDPLLAEAERWTRARLAEGFSIPDLARALGTTSRTLARRLARACGMSPIAFVNHIRREEAMRLLAAGSRFDQAAYAVGYSDPSALRRLLGRVRGR